MILMSKILTDKDIERLELFLSWYHISDDMLNSMSLNELYNLMIKIENKRGALKRWNK